MNTFDYPKAVGFHVMEPNEVFPDEIAIQFVYGSHEIAPAEQISTRLDLAQMKQLRGLLDKCIHELEHGFPESGEFSLN